MFNYIISVHNKEDILERTLEGVARCCSSTSRVYPVLDGCTDRSEEIVDHFIARTSLPVTKIVTPDVHEVRSLNAAFRRVTEGFVVCIQDDVVLEEPDLEAKTQALYAEVGPRLGVISPRQAMNVRRVPLLRQLKLSGLLPLVEECDLVRCPHEPADGASVANYGEVVYRMVAGGSPIIIPETVWRQVGTFDDAMAPYMWFDHEYSLRAMKAGFLNAIFPMHFTSRSEWGGMRQSKVYRSREFHTVVLRNRRRIWQLHGEFIGDYWNKRRKPTSSLL